MSENSDKYGIKELEKCMSESKDMYSSYIVHRFLVILMIFVVVLLFLMIPRSFWLIPSKTEKTPLNPYAEPTLNIIDENFNISPNNISKLNTKWILLKNGRKREYIYILPLAEYSITGRITAKNKFFYDKKLFDKYAKIDLGLVWGDMAKQEYFSKLSSRSSKKLDGSRSLMTFFSQKYKPKYGHLSPYLWVHFSHTHVVPANKNVMKALNAARYGQTIKLDGYLIDMYDVSKHRFAMTSLSTSDQNESSRGYQKGGGACEIMYVTSVQIGKKVFK